MLPSSTDKRPYLSVDGKLISSDTAAKNGIENLLFFPKNLTAKTQRILYGKNTYSES